MSRKGTRWCGGGGKEGLDLVALLCCRSILSGCWSVDRRRVIPVKSKNTLFLAPDNMSPNISLRFALGANNVCLVDETRRAPSRHCRDARVYGHTTTAMPEMRTPLPHPDNICALQCDSGNKRTLDYDNTTIVFAFKVKGYLKLARDFLADCFDGTTVDTAR